jgi:hypothetical protein
VPRGFSFSVRSVAVALCLLAPATADAQHTRVSVSTAGVQANGASSSPSVSADGRYVAFISQATNLVDGDTNGVADVFLRDRDTDTDGIFDESGAVSTRRLNLGPQGVQADAPAGAVILSGRFVAFRSAASTLVPGVTPGVQNIYVVDITSNVVDLATTSTTFVPADADCDEFDIAASGDGYVLVYRSDSRVLAPGDAGHGGGIYTRTFPERQTRRVSPPLYPQAGLQRYVASPTVDDAAVFVGFAIVTPGVTTRGDLYRALHTGEQLEYRGPGVQVRFDAVRGFYLVVEWRTRMQQSFVRRNENAHDSAAMFIDFSLPVPSADGRFAIVFRLSAPAFIHDFNSGEQTPLPFQGFGDWSKNGRWVVTATTETTLVPGDTNEVADVIAVDLPTLLDTDQDGLDDRWERLSGLSPADGTGANGPTGDPDGDGQTNGQEFATWNRPPTEGGMTHPTGGTTRYFAEGVANAFFDTQIDLANPSETTPAAVQVRYRTSVPATSVQQILIPPRQHRFVFPAGEIGGGDFGVEIESNIPVLADRRVTWSRGTGYGAHLETSQPSPATTWYLTEGTTVLGFNLFYLLLNPQDVTANVTLRYLRPSGPPIVRTYTILPHARSTLRVNDVDPALAGSDVSAQIVSDQPIIAERAMYADRQGQLFALGTASAGVTAPSTSWFLAEGATGEFFDLFVLIANPGTTDADVTARFLKPDGSVVTRQYAVAANSRFSIFADMIPGLESTPLSTEIVSTNGVPLVVERAMYWPGGFFDYYEGHTANGVTAPALRWGLAEGESTPTAQSFVLVANPGPTAGQARVTLLPEGTTSPAPTLVDVPANSRVTLPILPTGLFFRFGVLVESIGASPVPIVVEGAYYWTVNGQIWSAGGALVATPLP